MNLKHQQLIADYLAGDTSVTSQLLQACREDPNVLKSLSEHIAIDRLMHLEVNNSSGDVFTAELIQRLEVHTDSEFSNGILKQLHTKSALRKQWLFPLTIAACLILTLSSIFYINVSNQHTPLAQITASTNAVWENTTKSLDESIKKGSLKLTSGYSEITLTNGVSLLLEAPSQIKIESVNTIHLEHGKLVANVPEAAIGFTVFTPHSEIIDLGTEFGVNVNKNGTSQVHVLQGEVKARSLKNKEFHYLVKDQAMVFNSETSPTNMPSQPEIFLRSLPVKSAENPEYLHWSCDYNEIDNNILLCKGTGINNNKYHGSLKAIGESSLPHYQNGQFGQGLYFNGSNYIETDFLGIEGNNPRTVAFWAKIPKEFDLNHGYGMLGWGRMSKAAAWQISPNPNPNEGPIGRLRVGTYKAQVIGSTDLRDNRWHHITVVMYGGKHADVSTHILMYVDGKLETTSTKSVAKINTQLDHTNSKPLSMGVNLGFNLNQQQAHPSTNQQRKAFFKGWLDEIYVFDTALEPEQIQALITNNSFQ